MMFTYALHLIDLANALIRHQPQVSKSSPRKTVTVIGKNTTRNNSGTLVSQCHHLCPTDECAWTNATQNSLKYSKS